jgi:hypothetical protein
VGGGRGGWGDRGQLGFRRGGSGPVGR